MQEFFVGTPMGKLRACVKEDEDYPGVGISLVRSDGEELWLAWTEYVVRGDRMQTLVWQDVDDDQPSHEVVYTRLEEWTKSEV